MALFMLMGKYSPDAMKAILETGSDREAAAKKAVEAAGGKLLGFYGMFGQDYNVALITDMPGNAEYMGAVAPEEVPDRAEALLAAGQRVAVLAPPRADLPAGAAAFTLPADAAGFARELYARLREIDAAGSEVVVVAPPPESGLGLAVADRLRRAAAPRQTHSS